MITLDETATNDEQPASDLNRRAMLAALHISAWTGARLDRQAQATIAATHGNDPDRTRTIKRLLDPGRLAPLTNVRGRLTTTHNTYTLPWLDRGLRILPTATFRAHTEAMRPLIEEFRRVASDLIADYPGIRAAAQYYHLGTLYNSADYPPSIEDRFSVDLSYHTIPQGIDFRLDLASEYLDEIRQTAERTTAASIAEAQRDVVTRLKDAVSRMVAQLTKTDGKVYETLLSNASDLVALIPGLNITGDPAIAAIAADLHREILSRYTTGQLRADDRARADAAAVATRIESKLSGMLS